MEELRGEGVAIELVVRRTRRDPAGAVAAIAAELGADLVVCGTRGLRTLPGILLGRLTRRLPGVSPCPVLVARPRRGAGRAQGGARAASGRP